MTGRKKKSNWASLVMQYSEWEVGGSSDWHNNNNNLIFMFVCIMNQGFMIETNMKFGKEEYRRAFFHQTACIKNIFFGIIFYIVEKFNQNLLNQNFNIDHGHPHARGYNFCKKISFANKKTNVLTFRECFSLPSVSFCRPEKREKMNGKK